MSPAAPVRRRVRLAFVAVVSVLVGGLVVAPPSIAAEPGSIVLSGTILPQRIDAEHPRPVGDAYRVRAVNADSVVVKEIVTDESYSLTLPAGGSYAVRAEVIGDDSWYPSWKGGWFEGGLYGTPLGSDAQYHSASSQGVDIPLLRATTVSGTVTAAPVAGVTTTDFVIEAWYQTDNAGLQRLASLPTRGSPGTAVRYSFSGENRLPVGTYVFRLAEDGYPDYDDEYFEELSGLDKYAYQALYEEGLTGIDFTPTGYDSTVRRLAGQDRYETATMVSASGYTPLGSPLYIASGANWPDALSAGPAASAQGGSLLLTDPDVLSDGIADRIDFIVPSRIVVVGSALAVSEDVLRSLDALTDAPVVRIAGKDRYETSRKIVADAFSGGEHSTVFLATGTRFPDALSAAPIAGRRHEPVLLVDGALGTLDPATRRALDQLSPESAELVGGTPSLSSGLESALLASDLVETVHRTAGADRYDTGRRLNDRFPPNELTNEVYIASATGFADALAAGPVAADHGAPLYLSEQTCLPEETRTAMRGSNLDEVTLLGGTPTLSPALETLTIC